MKLVGSFRSIGIFLLLFIGISGVIHAQSVGASLYSSKACSACHGVAAEGVELLKAPALAGQETTYLIRQLNNFKKGARGYHIEDTYGRGMSSIAKALSDQEINDLALYLNSLTPTAKNYTLAGSPVEGSKSFLVCSACHGKNGVGNVALNAPNILILDDWYIKEQLVKFRKDWRGAPNKDPIGATMAPNAKAIADEDTVHNLAVYIHSLRYLPQKESSQP